MKNKHLISLLKEYPDDFEVGIMINIDHTVDIIDIIDDHSDDPTDDIIFLECGKE
jgi:hypothetical protein